MITESKISLLGRTIFVFVCCDLNYFFCLLLNCDTYRDFITKTVMLLEYAKQPYIQTMDLSRARWFTVTRRDSPESQVDPSHHYLMPGYEPGTICRCLLLSHDLSLPWK